MKIQSVILLFSLVGVLLASSLNKAMSEEALVQETDLKPVMSNEAVAKLVDALKAVQVAEDEAPFFKGLMNAVSHLFG